MLAGDHRAASLGVAMELAQVRPYQPGDDVRLIDWNATARMVEPHVRLHVAERALTTWLSSTPRPRWASERRCAARPTSPRVSSSRSATSRAAGAIASACSPTATRPALRAAPSGPARSGRSAAAAARGRGARESRMPAVARRPQRRSARARRHVRERSLIVIVSDLRGPRDWVGGLREICVKHDVSWSRSATPPRNPPQRRRDRVVDPETGRHVRVDTSRRGFARAMPSPPRRSASWSRTTSALPAPTISSSRQATTGCGRSSWASQTGRCCDDIRMATRPARARGDPARAALLFARAPAADALRRALQQRRRARDVARSTRSPWRFVPPALLLAALAALTVGMARP